MVTIYQLEVKVGLIEQYKKLALKYCNLKDVKWSARPKKDILVKMFERLDYKVKYISLDRLFIEKYTLGDYSF